MVAAKPQEMTFSTGVSGKYTAEKLDTVTTNWLKFVMAQHGALRDMAKDCNIELVDMEAKPDDEVP